MARIALAKPAAAFLDLIAWSEGTNTNHLTTDDGYDSIVTSVNGPNRFTDYSAHPFSRGAPPVVTQAKPYRIESTASGRYNITLPTWEFVRERIRAGTFSPVNQDLAALELLRECHALHHIEAGQLYLAFTFVSETWPSFGADLFTCKTSRQDELSARFIELLAMQH